MVASSVLRTVDMSGRWEREKKEEGKRGEESGLKIRMGFLLSFSV